MRAWGVGGWEVLACLLSPSQELLGLSVSLCITHPTANQFTLGSLRNERSYVPIQTDRVTTQSIFLTCT